MARCRSVMNLKATTKSPSITLACDLDADHMGILPFHYDKVNQLEWRPPLQPVAVAGTRTSPTRPAKASRSVSASVAAHTAQFEVVDA